MSNLANEILAKVSSRDAAIESYNYVNNRRLGLITSYKTKFQRLDNYLLGGIEPNSIMSISALSGGGKSTLGKCFRDSIWKYNVDTQFNQYMFNFEMLSSQQQARSIVSASGISLKKLYSVEEPLTDAEMEYLKKYYNELAKRKNTWFIETPASADHIAKSLLHYYRTECRPEGRALMYEIDHALLTKGRAGASEKERIDELMYALVHVKKEIAADGGTSNGIVLSQMNRDIRSLDRVKNSDLHRPSTSDLFGASSIEQCSDYVLFSHIPAKLNLQSYTNNNYPTRVKIGDRVMQMAYFELVKQRSGGSDLTIPMWNNLHKFDFDEMDKDIFLELVTQHRNTGICEYKPKQKQ